jgi:hypothetical protein
MYKPGRSGILTDLSRPDICQPDRTQPGRPIANVLGCGGNAAVGGEASVPRPVRQDAGPTADEVRGTERTCPHDQGMRQKSDNTALFRRGIGQHSPL